MGWLYSYLSLQKSLLAEILVKFFWQHKRNLNTDLKNLTKLFKVLQNKRWKWKNLNEKNKKIKEDYIEDGRCKNYTTINDLIMMH